MLTITIPAEESWDEQKEEFVITKKAQTLNLEHSLVSLSKWESKWHKPFMTRDKSTEESIDYVRCMTITQNVDPSVYSRLSIANIKEIEEYIDDPMTATTFSSYGNGGGSREIITAEIVYHSMIALNIPFECEKWHLNRLLTLIKVCNIKNQPGKKMSKGEIIRRNRELNEARKQQLNTKG